MRRASVVGPLILIGVGVLFMARNLWPEIPVMDFVARYWPFVLIGWGALRLIEILIWASTNKPVPVNGVSGGEWVLVIFLCLIGSGVYTVHRNAGWWRNGFHMRGIEVFGEPYDYSFSGEKQCGKTPKILIESFRGNARIIGGDADEVKITGRKTIRAYQQSEADQANQQSPLELAVQGDTIIVRTNQERVSGKTRISSDIELTVPKGASIEGRGRLGDFDISDLTGGVEIISDNAGVRLQNIGGDVRVDTRRSDIIRCTNVKGAVLLKGRGNDVELQSIDGQVSINGAYVGVMQLRGLAKPLQYDGSQVELHIEKVPGQVRMARGDFNAENLVGPIRLSTRSKDVQITDFTQSLEISLDRGDVELRPGKLPLGKIDVRTRSGDIEFSVPTAAKFDLKATTGRGEVQNEFGAPLKAENEGRGGSLRGAVGEGQSIVLSTDRGLITVRKATAENERTVMTHELPEAAPHAPKAPMPPRSLKAEEQ